jgi:hypothetical protein
MHIALATVTVFASVALVGCGTTKAEIDAATDRWRQRLAAEIPPGTDAVTAKQWFEKQGLRADRKPLGKSNDMQVLLESIPAREWYCGKWMVNADVRVSDSGKVTGYDVGALGQCL